MTWLEFSAYLQVQQIHDLVSGNGVFFRLVPSTCRHEALLSAIRTWTKRVPSRSATPWLRGGESVRGFPGLSIHPRRECMHHARAPCFHFTRAHASSSTGLADVPLVLSLARPSGRPRVPSSGTPHAVPSPWSSLGPLLPEKHALVRPRRRQVRRFVLGADARHVTKFSDEFVGRSETRKAGRENGSDGPGRAKSIRRSRGKHGKHRTMDRGSEASDGGKSVPGPSWGGGGHVTDVVGAGEAGNGRWFPELKRTTVQRQKRQLP